MFYFAVLNGECFPVCKGGGPQLNFFNIRLSPMKGKVKWFDTAKGYGFVTTEEGQDVFVHYTGIQGDGFRGLEQDQAVEFDLDEGKKGPQAINVTVIK